MTIKSTGNIYVNDYKKEPKQPDYTGFLEITKDQMLKLRDMGRDGEDVQLKIASWEKPSKQDSSKCPHCSRPNTPRFFMVAEARSKNDKGGSAPKKDDWQVPF
jgi:hypothetical protein